MPFRMGLSLPLSFSTRPTASAAKVQSQARSRNESLISSEDVRDLFIKLQDTIEAIDRAILDEERMTANAKEPEIPPG
jgi:hypothetical protein